MAKVQVITDSTADIPKDLVEKLGITLVPLKVHLEGQSYLDGVTIEPQEFYRKLAESEEMPTTSQPSPVDFVEAYREAAKDGETDIISIHLSSSFSGTYQSALLAQSMVEDEFKVTVIDSKTASYAIGMIVVEVAKAAQAGHSLDECVAVANRMIEEEQVYFLVDTLEYLQKGGRIGKASAMVGSLLNIKPILSIDREGVIFPIDKVRGKNKANTRIIELLKQNTVSDRSYRAGILYTDNREEAEKWAERLQENIPSLEETVFAEIGPVIGSHVGPGTVAVVLAPVQE
ncbi:DegV family protein [Paludifilum halophilum]|uniref:EDD domain protein n=1 Tax=Paludifilum halophilum TaxID=1642702 RepID=A0A235B295_9BACL|nr:DegV family protein [Paludifilum halophilum]OYD06430.1 EDD domain protein [Paludifilum halophilum]